MEVFGWIGASLLAVCAVPQAYDSWKTGNSYGITWGLLMLWLWGELFTLVYLFSKDVYDLPLICNYVANVFFVGIIIWYKLKPRITNDYSRTGSLM
jgi:uncharacterized protein with PQ loop repeat